MNMENLSYALADFGEIIALMVEAQGMTAENQARVHRGESMAYTDTDFQKLSGAMSYHIDRLRQL